MEETCCNQKPGWLDALLTEKFFTPCSRHASLKKNERNIFCVDCINSICQHCISLHSKHKLLQVRRYVYHDVIRLHDIQKLVDCSHVQTYIINSAKVVFLNQRPQPRPPKGLGNSCETCDRSLQESYHYCSVACKVDAVVHSGCEAAMASLLPRCNSLRLSDDPVSSPTGSSKDHEIHHQESSKPEPEEEFSPNSIFEEHDHSAETSSSPGSPDSNEAVQQMPAVSVPCATRRKARSARTIIKPSQQQAQQKPEQAQRNPSPSGNRRKSTPHRSPLS